MRDGQNSNIPPLKRMDKMLLIIKARSRNPFMEPTMYLILNKLHTKCQNAASCFQCDRLWINPTGTSD